MDVDSPVGTGALRMALPAAQHLQLSSWQLMGLRLATNRHWWELRRQLGSAPASETPLGTATALGAAATARRLVEAGAGPGQAWQHLLTLAGEARPPARPSSEAPALVQQAAEALLSGGAGRMLPPGPAALEAHAVAVHLAHPGGAGHSFRRCPWLLQRLLGMHASGQLAAPGYAEAAALVAGQPSIYRDPHALRAWLAVPALAGARAALLQLAGRYAEAGDAAALSTLLACCDGDTAAALQRQLAVQAASGPAGSGEDDWEEGAEAEAAEGGEPAGHAVACAALASNQPLLDLLLPRGTPISAAIIAAVIAAVAREEYGFSRAIPALQRLLGRGPLAVQPGAASPRANPIAFLLEQRAAVERKARAAWVLCRPVP